MGIRQTHFRTALISSFLFLASALGLAGVANATEGYPAFSKTFSPDTIGPGSTTTLTFTIDNSAQTEPADDLNFTDILPSGITIASPASADNTCGGTLSAPDGGSTISLSDGGVGAGATCTVTVNVVGTATATNSSGDLTSSLGNSGTAEADLTVDSTRIGFSKSFVPSSIPLGSTSTLTFDLTNDDEVTKSAVTFTDPLPAGMVVATPASVSNTCGGTVTATAGTSVISLAFGSIGGMSSCAVTVDVTTDVTGVFDNTTLEAIHGSPTAASGGFATASLEVPLEDLNKTFLDDPVPPGATTTLRFTVLNPSRTDTLTGATFTDPLPAGLSLASGPVPVPPCGAGSTLTGTTTLTFAGGTLPPEGSCTFDVVLDVPADASPGTYPNTTLAITGNLGGDAYTGNTASDDLTIGNFPLFTKEFTDDPVGAGGTVTLEFTLTNTATEESFFDLEFEDLLKDVLGEDVLPGLAANSLVDGNATDPLADVCGDGSELTVLDPPDIILGPTTIVIPPDPTHLIFTGGILEEAGSEGDSCTFSVVLDVPAGAGGGVYPNTTSELTGSDSGEGSVTAPPATDDLVVVGGVALTKEFTDDPVQPGGTVTLEFTLTNQNDTEPATAIAFADDFAAALAGLTATGLPLVTCGGTLSTADGGATVDFSGGSLAAGASCTFTVTLDVPGSAAPGPHANTTSTVTATVDGIAVTGNPAADDLQIAGLKLTKFFVDDPVLPGSTVTLAFKIENLSNTQTASSIGFSDDMATILGGTPDITTVDGSTVTDVCGAGNGTIFWTGGDTVMSFSGGALAPGEMCTFSVVLNVPGAAASGSYVNSTSGVDALMPATVTFDGASDNLVINDVFLQLTKEFTDDPVLPGGANATLEFTLTNMASEDAQNIAFSDDLGAVLPGLEATGATTNTCGGMAAGFPTGNFSYSGGSVAAGQSCSIVLNLTVPGGAAAGSYPNTTSGVTGTLGVEGPAITGDPASDDLQISALLFSKAFDGSTVAGGAPELTFTIENLGAAAVANLGFSDDLDAVVSGLIATGLPIAACGGTLDTQDGGSSVFLVGGSLGTNATCSIPVTLAVPNPTAPGTFTNTTSDLLQNGLPVAAPATADLIIEPPLGFAKAFVPATIGSGSVSQLLFTITNPDTAPVEGITFTDTLPAGVVIATPASATTSCTDGVLSAPAGGTTIGLTGARLGASSACTVSVNVTAVAPGSYGNVTGDLISTVGNSGTASATLTVDPARPGFSKRFAPNMIPPGGTSILTLTVDNSVNGAVASSLAFLDVLPAGLVIALPANANNTCGGTLTAVPGTNSISLALGSVGAASTCNVSVDVTTDTAGVFVNTTGELTSGAASPVSSGFATAALEAAEAALVKSFVDDPVPPGATVTLEFTINNLDRDNAATNIAFTDDLTTLAPPLAGLTFDSLLANDCGGSVSGVGTTTIGFSGGTLPAEGSCSVSVVLDVPAGAANGSYTNTTSALTLDVGGSPVVANAAEDILRVSTAPILSKEFTDDPVAGGDNVTLEFTITNTDASANATAIAFEDVFDTVIPTGAVLSDGFCGPGSTMVFTPLVDPAPPAIVTPAQLAVSGASLTPGASCTFAVTLDVDAAAAAGLYNNTTGPIAAMVDGQAVEGAAASDDLIVVGAPILSKSFTDDPVPPGGVVNLEFTLFHDPNNNSANATAIAFDDDLGAVLPGLGANEILPKPACGGTLTESSGVLSFTGGTLAPGDSCSFSVALSVPGGTAAGDYPNTTSDVTAMVGGVNASEAPAEDDLQIQSLVLTKEFTDDPVVPGGTVTLEFTLDNLDATKNAFNIAFSDDLSAALAGLNATSAVTNTCGGMAAALPSSFFDYSGGSLNGGNSCSIVLTVKVPDGAAPGEYTNITSDVMADVGGVPVTVPGGADNLVVLSTPIYADVPIDHPDFEAIQALADANVTSGCGTNDANATIFCPNQVAIRELAAIWLWKAKNNPVAPPDADLAPGGIVSGDVTAGDFADDFILGIIQQLITEGCDAADTIYCPKSVLTKAGAAKMLTKAAEIPELPGGIGPYLDVPDGHPAEDAIRALQSAGYVEGCGDVSDNNFCPDEVMTLAGLAKLVAKVFNLIAP